MRHDYPSPDNSLNLTYFRDCRQVLRSADYVCYTSVFLVVNGQRYEITVDTLPEEGETNVATSQ